MWLEVNDFQKLQQINKHKRTVHIINVPLQQQNNHNKEIYNIGRKCQNGGKPCQMYKLWRHKIKNEQGWRQIIGQNDRGWGNLAAIQQSLITCTHIEEDEVMMR